MPDLTCGTVINSCQVGFNYAFFTRYIVKERCQIVSSEFFPQNRLNYGEFSVHAAVQACVAAVISCFHAFNNKKSVLECRYYIK